VQAGQALGPLQRRADGGDRDRRGVGAEDAVGADDVFEVAVELLLGFEALDDGFDDEGGVGQVGSCSTAAGARRRGGGLGAHAALVGELAELGADAGDGLGGGLRAVVEQLDHMAGRRGDLGDAGTHGAGADHGDDGGGLRAAHAHSPVNFGARFSMKAATPSA
jgi:hypothetical protein